MEEYDSSACISLFEEALKNNEMNYNGKSISLPFNFSILQWSTDTRKIIDDAQLPDSVRFYSIYGTSYKTPYDVWLMDLRPLQELVLKVTTVGTSSDEQLFNLLKQLIYI